MRRLIKMTLVFVIISITAELFIACVLYLMTVA